MKKFISGILIGILLTLSITAFAAVELEVIPNPYKVLIDGKVADVQGYNINGGTYLKATDFIQAGLGVNFNKAEKQIEISTPSTQVKESISKATTTASQTIIDSDGSILFDPDTPLINTDNNATVDSIKVYKVDNKKYVSFADINIILKDTNMTLSLNHNTHIATLIDWTDSTEKINPDKLRKTVINLISLGRHEDWFFTYEDWINKIVPFIKEGK